MQPRNKNFKEHPSIHPIHPSIHPSVCLTVSMSARCRWRVPSSFLTSGFRCMRDTTWKSQKMCQKNCLHFWGRAWHEKVQKCVKKNVYTSGEGSDMKKSKKVSKKNVYTSGEGSDMKKSENVSKKNCLHFWGRVWHGKVKNYIIAF